MEMSGVMLNAGCHRCRMQSSSLPLPGFWPLRWPPSASPAARPLAVPSRAEQNPPTFAPSHTFNAFHWLPRALGLEL